MSILPTAIINTGNLRLRHIFYLICFGWIIFASVWLIPKIVSLYYLNNGGHILDQILRNSENTTLRDVACAFPPMWDSEDQLKIKQVLSDLRKSIEYNPNSIHAYLVIGRAYCMQGNFEEAITAYMTYSKNRSKNPLGHIELGFAYLKAGDEQSARREWQIAEVSSQEFIHVGEQARGASQFDEALRWYYYASALDSTNPDSYYGTGLVLQAQENYEKAGKAYLKAIEINPRNANYRFHYANLLLQMHEFLRAREEFEAAWKIYQSTSQKLAEADVNNLHEALFQLARISRKLDDWQAAETWYQEARRIHPEDIRLHAELADMYIGLGRSQDALEILRSIPEEQLNRTPLYHLFGRAYLQIGQIDMAIEELKHATEVSPNSAEMYYWLGEAYLAGGDRETAVHLYQKAIQFDSEFLQAQQRLDNLLTQNP